MFYNTEHQLVFMVRRVQYDPAATGEDLEDATDIRTGSSSRTSQCESCANRATEHRKPQRPGKVRRVKLQHARASLSASAAVHSAARPSTCNVRAIRLTKADLVAIVAGFFSNGYLVKMGVESLMQPPIPLHRRCPPGPYSTFEYIATYQYNNRRSARLVTHT